MAAYFIVHRRDIKDSERLKEYAKGVDDTIGRYDGKVVVRSDSFKALEGNWHPGREGDDDQPERITVIAFPDMRALEAWYGSDEYAPLRKIREESAVSDVAAVDGRDR